MIKYHNDNSANAVAEVPAGFVKIGSTDDIIDIIGEVGLKDCSRVIIHSESFSSEFYNLGSGVAGEILQKFSNYRMRLAIVGDFSSLKSNSWKDFIRESNRGRTVTFAGTVQDALSLLTDK
jgi:hypothetical protein